MRQVTLAILLRGSRAEDTQREWQMRKVMKGRCAKAPESSFCPINLSHCSTKLHLSHTSLKKKFNFTSLGFFFQDSQTILAAAAAGVATSTSSSLHCSVGNQSSEQQPQIATSNSSNASTSAVICASPSTLATKRKLLDDNELKSDVKKVLSMSVINAWALHFFLKTLHT